MNLAQSLAKIIELTCPHVHVCEVATGGWHFNGEPWDDIHTRLICMDCGEEILPVIAENTEEDPPF